jgi:hypothetical protein
MKKKGLAGYRQRRRRRNRAPTTAVARSNPGLLADAKDAIVPGFAAYAGTRFLSRVVFMLISRRWPKAGKHAAAASSVVAFLGAWFLAHRIKRLAKYHDGIVVGSGIAALSTVARTYLPKYGWIVADYEASDYATGNAAPSAPPGELPEPEPSGDEYDYLEAELAAFEAEADSQLEAAVPEIVKAEKAYDRDMAVDRAQVNSEAQDEADGEAADADTDELDDYFDGEEDAPMLN